MTGTCGHGEEQHDMRCAVTSNGIPSVAMLSKKME